MLDELSTFSAVARYGNMSRAASELHLSQPAISQRLRALEEEYGMLLLRRTNRGVELTPAGEIVTRYAKRILGLHQNLQDELNALRSMEPKQITIGATWTIGSYALPCTVYLFQQKNPAARIKLEIGNRQETLQRLADEAVDMALVEGIGVDPTESRESHQTMVVSEEDLVVITPTSGPWSSVESFSLDDLRRAPLILRDQGTGNRQILEYELKQHGLSMSDMNVAMELSSLEAVKTSVAQGHGVSLVSRWAVRVEARIGTLRMVPTEGISFRSRWTLVYPRSIQRTAMTRNLLRTLRSPAERGFC